MSNRILYAAGPGDVIQAHKHWIAGEQDPSRMSITYSSQFEDFCRNIDAEAYIVSYHNRKQIYREGALILEHRPKRIPGATGILYHLREVLYALSLLATAVRFRANYVVVDSGSTHFFAMSLFRLAGIRVVVVLHNCLWPAGFPLPPSKAVNYASQFNVFPLGGDSNDRCVARMCSASRPAYSRSARYRCTKSELSIAQNFLKAFRHLRL